MILARPFCFVLFMIYSLHFPKMCYTHEVFMDVSGGSSAAFSLKKKKEQRSLEKYTPLDGVGGWRAFCGASCSGGTGIAAASSVAL